MLISSFDRPTYEIHFHYNYAVYFIFAFFFFGSDFFLVWKQVKFAVPKYITAKCTDTFLLK